MRRIDSEQLKKIQLEILDEVDAFCRQEGIRYSLTGGSLIGAIRHHGYIPWDDDIDIMLPRPDYEKFFSLYSSKDNEAINLIHSNLCVEAFGKVFRKGTLAVDRDLKRGLWGVYIDLFPIDGFPYPEIKARLHFNKLESYSSRMGVYCPFYKVVGRQKVFWFFKYFLKRIISFYPHSFLHFKESFEKELRAYSFDDSAFAALFCGGDGWREVMRTSVFESYTDACFEGRTYRIITQYDSYLRSVFGDYMKYPPVEERHSKHNYDFYFL